MNKTPLVEVLIVTYNHRNYIGQALDSALSQVTSFDYQVVVGDDCSTDGTVEILREYERMYPGKLRVIYRQKNLGPYHPERNILVMIKSARAKYVALLDGDDYWTDTLKLQKQTDILEQNPDFAICFHNVKILKDDKISDNYIGVPKQISSLEDLSKGNYIHSASSVFRNNLVTLPSWYSALHAGDYPLHLLLAQKGNIYFLNESMSVYRIHDRGIYTNADPIQLLKGNIVLLSVLINSFKEKKVKENLRVQLKGIINQLVAYLLDKGMVRASSKLAARYPFLINKHNQVLLFKKLGKKVFPTLDSRKDIRTEPIYYNKSYSQCGEDLIINYLFNLRGVHHPSYIDIGANHPYYISNTAFFYQRGCRGINIEANPELINEFRIYRPEDTNLNIGLSDLEGELDFYIMQDHTLSTFSKEESDFMIANGKLLKEVRKIKLKAISTILEKYCNNIYPDFMSIDVEGMDFQILRSIDYEKSCPKVICVEAAEYSPIGAGTRRNDLIDFLVSKGYYEYANTNLNAIMVRKEFWFI